MTTFTATMPKPVTKPTYGFAIGAASGGLYFIKDATPNSAGLLFGVAIVPLGCMIPGKETIFDETDLLPPGTEITITIG